MADDLEEQILKLNLSKLTAGLSGVTVQRVPGTPSEIDPGSYPAVALRKGRKVTRQHLRGAEEMVITVQAICLVDGEGTDPSGALSTLRARVKELVEDNFSWHNGSSALAASSEIVEDADHETEVVRGAKTGLVAWNILAYADRNDPTQVKAL